MVRCQKCGKETYSSWKKLCGTCYKASKIAENKIKEEQLLVKQSKCEHPNITETRYPTHSGCTMIIENICIECGKVMSHRSEDIDYPQQQYFRH